MANLGFVDTKGQIFHINQNPDNSVLRKKKKKDEAPAMAAVTQTVKPTQTVKSTANTVNADGYTETNKKYGDYKYQDYANKKDYKVYKKDGKSYYYNENTKQYVDMDTPTMTSAEQDKKDYEEAIKNGYKPKKTYKKDSKGNTKQVAPAKISEKVELDTSDLTKKEKEKYKKSLIKQEKQKGKEDSYVRTSGTGIDALVGAYNNQFKNPDSVISKNIIQPAENAGRIYESGKLNNELAIEWYKKMQGKENKVDEIQRKIDNYNKFNQDVASGDVGFLGNTIQNLNTQVESLKNQGIATTLSSLAGAAGGAALGLKSGDVAGGALKGAKLGAKLGYTWGSTPYMYQLEAGNTYKDLKEMGVSDSKAKNVSNAVGAINAAIESGENIIDLISFSGAGKIAGQGLKNTAVSQMQDQFDEIVENLGQEEAKKYIQKLYGKEVADQVLKSYAQNLISEGLEEGSQETVGILGERYATGSEGIKRDASLSDDLQRIGQASLAGAGSAVVLGLPTMTTGNLTSYAGTRFNNQINQNNQVAMTKVQNMNDVERNALTEITMKRKQGIPLDENDMATINYLNNRDNVVTDQNTQQLQNTINPTTLQESANQYGYKGDAEQLANIQTMLDNRGIQSRFDASIFNDNDVNALWSIDENGNREVVFNPNANENDIMEEVSVHELAHDIMASENSKIALKPQEVLNYVQTLEGYEQARADLENTYSQVYDKNSPEFKSLIDEEVVADFLGKRLGNQEYVTQLTNSNPSFARKIYNWIVDKIDSLVNSNGKNVRSERLYWQNLKNNFEKAYNMEYQNNKANVKYKFESISPYVANEYKNATNKQLDNKEFAKLATIVESSDVKRGISKINNIYDENTNTYRDYTIYKKAKGEFKVLDSIDSDVYNGTEGDNNGRNGYRVKESRSSNRLDRVGIEENNNQETRTGNDAILRNNEGQNRKSEQIDFEDNRNKRNGKELDNSSFLNNEERKTKRLTVAQQKAFDKTNNNEKLTEKEFYRLYSAHKIYNTENAQNIINAIKEEGFKGDGGFGVNLVPSNISYKENGEPLIASDRQYAPRKGEYVLLVPESEVDESGGGYRVRQGYKPRDFEVVKVDRDFQPYYELYEKAFDKYINNDTDSTSLTKDNKTPTSNANIRYSISKKTGKLQDANGKDVKLDASTTGNTGTLMAIHNLNENKLKGILELGGFPVPSIAVTNPNKINHNQYGEITVLFDKNTIDPANGYNEVYDRDVWSPTFPTVDYNIDSKQLESVANDLGIRDYDLEDYADNNKTPEFLSDRLTRDEKVVDKYIKDNNIEYETIYKNPELSVEFNELSKDIQKFVKDNDFDVFKLSTNEKLRNEYFGLIKDYYDKANFPEQSKQSLYQDKIDFLNNWIGQQGKMDSMVVRGLQRYQNDFDMIKSGQEQVVDEWRTEKSKREAAINNGLQDYLVKKVAPLFNEKGIYNGKEYLTPSGNRRSFWQLHDEYNLDNVVNAMTKGSTKGTQNWIAGFGQIQAQMANQFNTIDEIRAAQDRLVADEDNTRLKDLRARLEADIDLLADKHDGWNGMEIGSELLADFASKKNHDISTFRKLLRNDYQSFAGITDNEITQMISDLEELRDLPTDYFEAKPQRAVGLDEVQAMIVPNNIDAGLKKQLQDQGLTYYEYDPNIEGDRNRVINQFDDLKFKKQSEGWEDFLDRNVKNEGTKTRLKDLKVPKETKTTQSKAKLSRSEEISAKKDESVITVRNNKGQELKLKQDKTNPNVYKKEVKIPRDNKSIVPKETMQKQLAKLKDGTKVSNFYSNLTENSKFITQENASKLSQEEIWRYAPQTNKETMANAEARIGDTQKSLETAYGDFLSKGENFSPEDVGVGWILLKRFQDAGNYDAMVQVAKKMRNIATKSGQTVQMFNLQSRLTPEGMVKYAQSELMEAEQQFNKGKSQKEIDKYAKDFELTGEEVEFIKNQMEKIQGMEDGRAKNIEMAKINKMLSDKLPHQRGESIKAWMRMSMLFNPKTQVRNVVGNALITPINALADVPASIADKAISKKTGTRTIGAPSLGGIATYGKGFARGGVEAWQDYRMGLDTKDVDMSRFDITQKNPFVTDHKGAARVLNPISKGLNKANAFLDLVMSGGDRVFYQGAFDASLRNQMELNNVKTPTQDMIDIATQEALARTWNDNNGYTQFVLNTRRALNKASFKGYGLGDVLIPFAKTPANLTKAIYDYSPVGLTTTLFKTKSINNAIETGQITAQMQHDFAQNLGKGVAGTMLYAMAYALAKAGIATGSSDDDKDVANFIKNTMGIQPYSIKIGDKSFTYDWAQPVAAPIAIASDAYQNLTRDSDEDTATRIFNTILDVSNTGFNVLMQQSFLQGISEVLNSNEGVANGIIEQVIGLPARAVPTFVQQINNMFDKTQRVAFEKNQPLKTGKQNVMSKLPGQSQRLAPRVDALGNEVQRYGDSESDLTYALKNFLSPANQSNRKTSKAASEIYKVYEATGDKTIMPMVAPYYIQNKTVGRIDLDSKDRATYQKISGKLVNDAVVELTNDTDYNKLSYDEKAEVLNGVVSYANAKAKEHFTGFMANTYNPANKKINNGMSIADYYLEKTMNKR